MEVIHHVHLTKTDFENIRHLRLTRVCFSSLQISSPLKSRVYFLTAKTDDV